MDSHILVRVAAGEEAVSVDAEKSHLTIGRDDHNDIVLSHDKAVSSSHAVLRRLGPSWIIEDLQSKNGVYLHSPSGADWVRVVNAAPVLAEQRIRLGRSTLVITRSESAIEPVSGGDGRRRTGDTDTATLSIRKEGESIGFEMPVVGAFATCHTVPYSRKDVVDALGAYHVRTFGANGGEAARSREALVELGRFLRAALIPQRIAEKLDGLSSPWLRLVIDAPLLDIPWELIECRGMPLGCAFSVGRQIRVEGVLSAVVSRGVLHRSRVFLLANPTGDLPELTDAMEHQLRLIERSVPHAEIDCLSEERIRRYDVLQRLGNYDAVLYAGHADDGRGENTHAGWRLDDGHITPADLRMLTSPPRFVFANGCGTDGGVAWRDRTPPSSGNLALTHALVLAGSAHVVGTMWPVGALEAPAFGRVMLSYALQGWSIGESMRFARQHFWGGSRGVRMSSWPAYVLYGEPDGHVFPVGQDGFESA